MAAGLTSRTIAKLLRRASAVRCRWCWDRVILGQILANLLSDALTFVPSDRKPELKIWASRIFKLFKSFHTKDEYAGLESGSGLSSEPLASNSLDRPTRKVTKAHRAARPQWAEASRLPDGLRTCLQSSPGVKRSLVE